MLPEMFKQIMTKENAMWLRVIPIVGWVYIVIGLILPFDNIVLKLVWYIDIALSVGLHSLQLFIAVPVGRKAGISDRKTIVNTLLFGATWWRPLQASDKKPG